MSIFGRKHKNVQVELDVQRAFSETMDAIQNDIAKRKAENAKKVVLRLTNVTVKGTRLFRDGADVTEEVVKELKTGYKRAVWAFSETVEMLTQTEPTIFDGWELVIADEDNDISMTDFPKKIEQKDESSEDFAARVKHIAVERHKKKDKDSDDSLNMILMI